jgi:UDP-N-acetylglucosamine 2-epimerase (non-hydrolysing)
MKIVHVVGARPNFMKVAPLMAAIERAGFAEQLLVHTGQHYDASMSDVFFEELGLRRPDVFLGVGGGTPTEQTAQAMLGFEKVLARHRPDLVVVVGDVNSTIAAALAATQQHVRVAHVEAGLRSADMSMPEEVNRVLTDRISDLLLTPSEDANENLRREGLPEERIHLVGNIMIDTLLSCLPRARTSGTVAGMGLQPRKFAVMTVHRAANVDDEATLVRLVEALEQTQARLPVVFPLHPRTKKQLQAFGMLARVEALPGVKTVGPQGYLEMIDLVANAAVVLTDSGGLQEETTALGVPCITLRDETERPITVSEGTNVIVGTDVGRIMAALGDVLAGKAKKGHCPALWDGRTSERIVEVMRREVRERAPAVELGAQL